jgi:hypothetical protein
VALVGSNYALSRDIRGWFFSVGHLLGLSASKWWDWFRIFFCQFSVRSWSCHSSVWSQARPAEVSRIISSLIKIWLNITKTFWINLIAKFKFKKIRVLYIQLTTSILIHPFSRFIFGISSSSLRPLIRYGVLHRRF